jgi:Tol biopolymer transport system component
MPAVYGNRTLLAECPDRRSGSPSGWCVIREELRTQRYAHLYPHDILNLPMPLSPGERLGPYEVLAPIGAGGMGEVYRARDTKLDREVAIKVLPSELASDPERLVRFEREAKVLAALNHPNIAQLYGLEDSGDIRALAMELVLGHSLSQLLASSGAPELPIALDYAHQIAEALESAHDRGIIHRDLKPGNVMVTPEGVVKVLDFGLAAMPAPEAPMSGRSADSPTMTVAATRAGMLLGTASYMAPEQAAGKPVDKRSDIWAYGVVLWELLTGKMLFGGASLQETLADVLRAPIHLDGLPQSTPEAIRALLRRCLDRNVKQRLRDIGEARVVLSGILEELRRPEGRQTPVPLPADATTAAAPGRTLRSGQRSRAIALSLGGLLFAAVVILGYMIWTQKRQASVATQPVMRFEIPMDGPLYFPTVSPDGHQMVFIKGDFTARRLYWRRLDSIETKEIAESENASFPFWSPDSRHLAFFSEGKLKRIEPGGAHARVLCAAPNARGGAWGEAGVIVFAPDVSGPLFRIPAEGGTAVQVTEARGRSSHRFPEFLPGGQTFLFSQAGGFSQGGRVHVADLSGKQSPALPEIRGNVRFVRTTGQNTSGMLVYRREGTLIAQAFDPVSLKLSDSAVPIVDQVNDSFVTGFGEYSLTSSNGVLLYKSGTRIPLTRLQWFDRSGRPQPKSGPSGHFATLALSPDGKKVALTRGASLSAIDVWILDLFTGVLSQFTTGGNHQSPVWFPDGSRIAYVLRAGTPPNLLSRPTAGGQEQGIGHARANASIYDVSPDGKTLIYSDVAQGTGDNLWFQPLEPGAKPTSFVQSESNDQYGQFSPDGHWVAYQSGESGIPQIYVQPIPATGAILKVSKDSGTRPRWRRDGKELFYLSSDDKMMAVPVFAGKTFQSGAPQELFAPTRFIAYARGYGYQPSADGQRFLGLVPATDAPPPLTVVVNWHELLKDSLEKE